jgi:mannose-6-phosphate isomerase-like protein (cupin superfamily)
MIVTAVHSLPVPLAACATGWMPYPQFSGRTASLDFMGCHVSVLSPGHSPHLPHSHVEEEILIVLSGEAEAIIASREDDISPRRERILPGQFTYYPAWQYHTLRNVSDAPVTYLMFKWSGGPAGASAALDAGLFDARPLLERKGKEPFSPKLLFEASTRWLRRLHCHVTVLDPGGGYEPHADPYDVAIVVFEGILETVGQTLIAPGVIYYGRDAQHGMRNAGNEPARYIVFEFDNGCTSPT